MENIEKILETIQTLNLNIDSNSAIEIVDKIRPLLWATIIRGYIGDIFFTIIFLSIIYFGYKYLNKRSDLTKIVV